MSYADVIRRQTRADKKSDEHSAPSPSAGTRETVPIITPAAPPEHIPRGNGRRARDNRIARDESHETPTPRSIVGRIEPRASRLRVRSVGRSGLLHQLRALAIPVGGVPTVVIASVSGREDYAGLLRALKKHVDTECTPLAMVELAVERSEWRLIEPGLEGRQVLGTFDRNPHGAEGYGVSWNQTALGDRDLVLVLAPPLAQSVDGALLGRDLGGAVLVGEVDRTSRHELRKASQQLVTADCPLLGVVLLGAKRWLPEWLERLLDNLER